MSIVITKVRNAVSIQPNNLRMDVEIDHPDYGWIPYTVDPTDTDTTIDNDALMDLIGDSFAPYVPPTQAELDEASARAVRATRDMKLATEVDPIAGNALRWAALDVGTQAAWAAYRQALLDVPAQAGFPHNVTWPEVPST